MADKKNPEENPEHGWAQMLPELMTDNINIEVAVWESSTNDCLGFLGEKESADPLLSMSAKGGNTLKIT